MEVNELEYNTHMPKMALSEYGRNIQRMVDYAMTIEDREERCRCAQDIIRIMGNLFPHLRDVADFNHKLWDHLAIMSDFKLDIDYPFEPLRPEDLSSKPEKVPYQNHQTKWRHYGYTVQELIAKACDMEDGDEKQHLLAMIANHMKKSYYMMNKDVPEDAKIFEDINYLSQGKLQVQEGSMTLVDVKDNGAMPKKVNGKNNNRRK